MKFDIAIIGGGPGGYTAAEAAAREGLSVVLFEREQLGGTCLNRGCIPTKALLHATEAYSSVQHCGELGIDVNNYSYNFEAMHERKNQVVLTLRQSIEKLMKSCRVTVVSGSARITGETSIVCKGESFEAENIIIATGSRPAMIPVPGIDLDGVYTSDDLLEGAGIKLKSLVIIGGGVIGVECASIYLMLDASVTIIESMEHILPSMDRELSQRLTMSLKKQGAVIEAGATVTSISGAPGNMAVSYRTKKGEERIANAEGVLVAAGCRAQTAGLFADNVELELQRDAIVSDKMGRTSIPNIYVIGDARYGNIQLAHVAAAQARNVVALIAGKDLPVDESIVPSCIFTNPEIASVGLTESQAKEMGYAVKTLKTLTGANGKCVIENAQGGFVKLVTDSETGVILGAQLICPRATDLIGELSVAVQTKMTAKQLSAVIHAHPTFYEIIGDCAALW